VALTATEALALLPEWQKRLRLQDWQIEGSITDQVGQPLAKATLLAKYKAARIAILNPVKVEEECSHWIGNKDPEVSIVHELLHLQGESLNTLLSKKKYARYDADMERLVELTAIALVALKREVVAARNPT
jgi:hypothetical protein